MACEYVQEKQQEAFWWIEGSGVDRRARGSGNITNPQYKGDDIPGLRLDRVREPLTSVNLTFRSASRRNLPLGHPDTKCKSDGKILNGGHQPKPNGKGRIGIDARLRSQGFDVVEYPEKGPKMMGARDRSFYILPAGFTSWYCFRTGRRELCEGRCT